MNDVPHVDLVDSHAERHRGADDLEPALRPRPMHLLPARGLDVGVVEGGGEAGRAERLRHVLALLLAEAVHEPRRPAVVREVRRDPRKHLLGRVRQRVRFERDLVKEVGPVHGEVEDLFSVSPRPLPARRPQVLTSQCGMASIFFTSWTHWRVAVAVSASTGTLANCRLSNTRDW